MNDDADAGPVGRGVRPLSARLDVLRVLLAERYPEHHAAVAEAQAEIERLRAHHFFAMHNPSVCNGRMMGEPMRYTPECVPLKAENERLRQQLADVAMSLKTCAWALRRGAAPELGERSLELLKKYDLLGSPLRA